MPRLVIVTIVDDDDFEQLSIHRLRKHARQTSRQQVGGRKRRNDDGKLPIHDVCRWVWPAFNTTNDPITNASSGVLKNASIAAFGVHTIGSPRTLKDVLISTGTPFRLPNASSRACTCGLLSRSTVWTRAVSSTWHADGMLRA